MPNSCRARRAGSPLRSSQCGAGWPASYRRWTSCCPSRTRLGTGVPAGAAWPRHAGSKKASRRRVQAGGTCKPSREQALHLAFQAGWIMRRPSSLAVLAHHVHLPLTHFR